VAPPGTGFTTSVRKPALEAGLRSNKITADGPPSIQGFVKDAKGEPIQGADVRMADRRRPDTRMTAAPPETGFTTKQRHHAVEAGLRTNKITADGPPTMQGFVKA